MGNDFGVDFGGPIHVGDRAHGFLTDPDKESSRHYNPDLFTLDQLLNEPRLILCGDPGIGKSTVIQEAGQRTLCSIPSGTMDILFFLDFRDLPNENFSPVELLDSAEWKRWKNINRQNGALSWMRVEAKDWLKFPNSLAI